MSAAPESTLALAAPRVGNLSPDDVAVAIASPQARGGDDTPSALARALTGIALTVSPTSTADDFAATVAGVRQVPQGTTAGPTPESPTNQYFRQLQEQYNEDLRPTTAVRAAANIDN